MNRNKKPVTESEIYEILFSDDDSFAQSSSRRRKSEREKPNSTKKSHTIDISPLERSADNRLPSPTKRNRTQSNSGKSDSIRKSTGKATRSLSQDSIRSSLGSSDCNDELESFKSSVKNTEETSVKSARSKKIDYYVLAHGRSSRCRSVSPIKSGTKVNPNNVNVPSSSELKVQKNALNSDQTQSTRPIRKSLGKLTKCRSQDSISSSLDGSDDNESVQNKTEINPSKNLRTKKDIDYHSLANGGSTRRRSVSPTKNGAKLNSNVKNVGSSNEVQVFNANSSVDLNVNDSKDRRFITLRKKKFPEDFGSSDNEKDKSQQRITRSNPKNLNQTKKPTTDKDSLINKRQKDNIKSNNTSKVQTDLKKIDRRNIRRNNFENNKPIDSDTSSEENDQEISPNKTKRNTNTGQNKRNKNDSLQKLNISSPSLKNVNLRRRKIICNENSNNTESLDQKKSQVEKNKNPSNNNMTKPVKNTKKDEKQSSDESKTANNDLRTNLRQKNKVDYLTLAGKSPRYSSIVDVNVGIRDAAQESPVVKNISKNTVKTNAERSNFKPMTRNNRLQINSPQSSPNDDSNEENEQNDRRSSRHRTIANSSIKITENIEKKVNNKMKSSQVDPESKKIVPKRAANKNQELNDEKLKKSFTEPIEKQTSPNTTRIPVYKQISTNVMSEFDKKEEKNEGLYEFDYDPSEEPKVSKRRKKQKLPVKRLKKPSRMSKLTKEVIKNRATNNKKVTNEPKTKGENSQQHNYDKTINHSISNQELSDKTNKNKRISLPEDNNASSVSLNKTSYCNTIDNSKITPTNTPESPRIRPMDRSALRLRKKVLDNCQNDPKNNIALDWDTINSIESVNKSLSVTGVDVSGKMNVSTLTSNNHHLSFENEGSTCNGDKSILKLTKIISPLKISNDKNADNLPSTSKLTKSTSQIKKLVNDWDTINSNTSLTAKTSLNKQDSIKIISLEQFPSTSASKKIREAVIEYSSPVKDNNQSNNDVLVAESTPINEKRQSSRNTKRQSKLWEFSKISNAEQSTLKDSELPETSRNQISLRQSENLSRAQNISLHKPFYEKSFKHGYSADKPLKDCIIEDFEELTSSPETIMLPGPRRFPGILIPRKNLYKELVNKEVDKEISMKSTTAFDNSTLTSNISNEAEEKSNETNSNDEQVEDNLNGNIELEKLDEKRKNKEIEENDKQNRTFKEPQIITKRLSRKPHQTSLRTFFSNQQNEVSDEEAIENIIDKDIHSEFLFTNLPATPEELFKRRLKHKRMTKNKINFKQAATSSPFVDVNRKKKQETATETSSSDEVSPILQRKVLTDINKKEITHIMTAYVSIPDIRFSNDIDFELSHVEKERDRLFDDEDDAFELGNADKKKEKDSDRNIELNDDTNKTSTNKYEMRRPRRLCSEFDMERLSLDRNTNKVGGPTRFTYGRHNLRCKEQKKKDDINNKEVNEVGKEQKHKQNDKSSKAKFKSSAISVNVNEIGEKMKPTSSTDTKVTTRSSRKSMKDIIEEDIENDDQISEAERKDVENDDEIEGREPDKSGETNESHESLAENSDDKIEKTFSQVAKEAHELHLFEGELSLKPTSKNYSNKTSRKRRYASPGQDANTRGTAPPKKKKKDKLTKKEKAEADKWAQQFNSMCEEIEQYDLCVENESTTD